MKRNNEMETHPSWVLVGFSRYTGSSTFFASPVIHHGGVELTVKRAVRQRELNRDWIYGRDQLIQVRMSFEQFATAITAMNQGDGHPATLAWLPGEGVIPDPPFDHHRAPFQGDLKATVGEVAALMRPVVEKIEKMQAAKSITKGDVAALASDARMMQQQVVSNLPFLIRSFRERMDQVETAAKIEITATLDAALRGAGLEALANRLEQSGPLAGLLLESEVVDDDTLEIEKE